MNESDNLTAELFVKSIGAIDTTPGSWKSGIDSIKTFMNDVYEIIYKGKKPKEFKNNRPTFSEALFSTSILEAALKSLSRKSAWIKVQL